MNPTTAYDILADLEGKLDKCKRTGDTLKARCPAHEDKAPSLDITIGDSGDRVVMYCHAGCPTDAVLDTLGLEMRDLFATDDAWNSHTTLEWANPSTGQVVTQRRHYTGTSKYTVERGTETKALVYLARHDPDATRPILWTEGAKAAKSAALKLPANDFDVVGFFSASTIPNAATLAKIAKGRPCVVWPDYDEAGAKAGQRLVSDLLKAGADDVTTIDPALLGLTAGRHDDAEQWHPDGSPGDELRAACVAATPEESSPLPSGVPERVQTWIASLKAADLEGKIRILHSVKEAPEWQQLAVELRIAVVWAIKDRMVLSMATVILGKLDDRTGIWREPPNGAVDTSEPDVVSLETILADPPELTTTVARGLAFGGTMGFIHGPKASGKTTILAAAAARVSQGQQWAGQSTAVGTVLVVTDDDPRSWTLALHDFGADTTRILMARARVVSRPGKLAALLAEHTPAWVIIDNLRTWCGSMDRDVDSSSSAALAIDPLAQAIRDCDHPVACTLLHNEARSKSEGVVVKGVPGSPYVNRLRNSTVFEDAADWIVGCAHVSETTTTTITAGEKTRRGIPTETLVFDLSADGRATSTTIAEDDPFTVKTPANPLDEKIREYLVAHPEGVSQNAVLKAGGGKRRATMAARLKVVGTLGTDDLWRCATGRKSPAEPSQNLVLPEHEITPPEQVLPEAQTGGGENRVTGGVLPVLPANGNRGGNTTGNVTHPIGVTPRVTVPGNTPGTHLAAPNLLALAGAKTTGPSPPRGGSGESNFVPQGDEVHSTDRGKQVSPSGTLVSPLPESGKTLPSGGKCFSPSHRSLPAPEVHSSGIKKWDDATSTWVDTLPGGDVFMVEGGIVHLSERTTVTDGDPNIHWDMTWTDIELDREEMVDYQ